MSDFDLAIRAGELAIAAASPLVRLLMEELSSASSEEEALRTALARLASRPDLQPILPAVRVMVARAHERVDR